MSKRKRAAVWVAALAIVCGLVIWHAVHWHSTGRYLEMFGWIGTDRAYATVLYNLGLMVLLGTVLGILMHKITDLLGYEVNEVKHSDGDAQSGTGP